MYFDFSHNYITSLEEQLFALAVAPALTHHGWGLPLFSTGNQKDVIMDITHSSTDTKELAKAMLKVQSALTPAIKDATNPFTQNRYATFNCVMDTCRDALQDNGIWLCQYPVQVDTGHMGLVTKLTHAESGQWQASLAVVPLPKADPQGYGSCITYAKRYALTAMLGMVTEDDDGEGAKIPEKSGVASRRPTNAPQRQKESRTTTTQGPRQNSASKPTQEQSDFSDLPRIDGVTYQSITTTDGRPCIVAVGNTQPKKEVLAGIGFKWNPQRKFWWKYADAS